jgi:hypothetical protein
VSGIGKVRKEIGANVRSFRKRGEKADLHPVNYQPGGEGANAGKRPGLIEEMTESSESKANKPV